jgi:dTDP-4-dehydrorhamnose reductase
VSAGSVLITGGGGQLASELEAVLTDRATVHAPMRDELDISDEDALDSAFAQWRPALVLNCAAFHNVDLCEREELRSFEVNAAAVKRLAERCRDHDARLVHFSTNYVFDGGRPEPYDERDIPSPRSVYAISKLAGEHAALAYRPGSLVVRTAGLYGLHGSASKGGNFVTRMVARAREQGSLKLVSDQELSPTFSHDLALGTVEAVESEVSGVLHLTNAGHCSWHEFTTTIVRIAGLEVPVEPIATEAKVGAAERPLNGVLARRRVDELGLTPLRPWPDALEDYMRRAGLAASLTT